MGLFDDVVVENVLNGDVNDNEDNKILSNKENALKLISKVLEIKKGRYYQLSRIDRLDNMIDDAFLSSLKKIQMANEAQIQIELAKLSDKLMEQKKYTILRNKATIGIGGKFSAGKSKFINSLLKSGEEFLPEDQNPTTSIPTYMIYGENEEIKAFTRDDNEVLLSIEEMQALTHKFFKEYHIGFSSFIDSLVIVNPDLPYKELAFLDTPGYSKADEIGKGRTQRELSDKNRAYEQLRSVDYLIWLVDIENGTLVTTDIDFILKVGVRTPILIVANKSDKKSENEIASILDEIKNSAIGADINLYDVTAYSSRNGQEWHDKGVISGFFEYALNNPIKKDDIIARIEDISFGISAELKSQIEHKTKERNPLCDIIYRSDNILEIKSLVDLYGDSMESLRSMKQCRTEYNRTIRKIKNLLKEQYLGE